MASPDSDRKESGQPKCALPQTPTRTERSRRAFLLMRKAPRGSRQEMMVERWGDKSHWGRPWLKIGDGSRGRGRARGPLPAPSGMGVRSFPPGPLEQAGSAWPDAPDFYRHAPGCGPLMAGLSCVRKTPQPLSSTICKRSTVLPYFLDTEGTYSGGHFGPVLGSFLGPPQV